MLPADKDGRLVTLKPGKYFKASIPAGSHPSKIKFDKPTTALLVEYQGRKTSNSDETCWYALVDGDVVLVWDDSFDGDDR